MPYVQLMVRDILFGSGSQIDFFESFISYLKRDIADAFNGVAKESFEPKDIVIFGPIKDDESPADIFLRITAAHNELRADRRDEIRRFIERRIEIFFPSSFSRPSIEIFLELPVASFGRIKPKPAPRLS